MKKLTRTKARWREFDVTKTFATAIVILLSVVNTRAGTPTYLFFDFEPDSKWTVGAIPSDDRRIHTPQGLAEIVKVDEEKSTQMLQLSPSNPFTAVVVDTSPLADFQEVFCEVLARPLAVDESTNEEFFDFGGATLGFFRQGDRGELWALFSQTAEDSVWISTGLGFALNEGGSAAEWIQLKLHLNRATNRWALSVNGESVLEGLKLVEMKGDVVRPLLLYGHEAGRTQFDDVLLSDIDPDELEAIQKRQVRDQLAGKHHPKIGPKYVMQQKPRSEPRLSQTLVKDRNADTSPVLLGWHLNLDSGQRTYESKARFDRPKSEPSIVAYAPGYDDNGNPLSAKLTITADAALRPGANLSRLRWRVRELITWPDKFGQLIGEGDFSDGLVQYFVLAPEWTRKATSVEVYLQADETP